MRDVRERLTHMLEAIERIERYAIRGEEAFHTDELIQNWMVRHLLVLGEASRALPLEFQKQHPEVPWSYIIGMRNVLVHEYFGIDLDIVWRVINHDLPGLKHQLNIIILDMI